MAVEADDVLRLPRHRILFLAKLFPWPLNFGARQRVFHLVKGLASVHHVDVIVPEAQRSAQDIADFLEASGCASVLMVPRENPVAPSATRGRAVRRLVQKCDALKQRVATPVPQFVHYQWSESLLHQLVAWKAAHQVDLVYATQSWTAEHARAAGFKRILVDVDDLISKMSAGKSASPQGGIRRLLNAFELRKEARYEQSLPRRFAHVTVAKDNDLPFFPIRDRARVSVVPNGIRVAAQPLPESRDSATLLFVGMLNYGPNVDAIRWLASDILPLIWKERPDVRLEIAGFGSGAHLADALTDARCTVHESPPDLAPLYARAAAVLAPIRTGGGTRIKVLEGLAMGRATICTEFAAEGLALRDGVDLEFGESAEEIAALTLALLKDPERRTALAERGRERVVSRYDWRVIEAQLPQLLVRMGFPEPAAS